MPLSRILFLAILLASTSFVRAEDFRVSEAWCHQRGYVCMIEEFGGRPVKAGESFSAAFIVGYFDTIEEMHAVYDEYKGRTVLEVSEKGWTLK